MIDGQSYPVFLVEDEVLIRMMVSDMLEDLGHRVVVEAGELSQAVKLAQSAIFDLAILDMNLQGEMSFSVADALEARQLPFIFSSGYDPTMASHVHRNRLVLRKPYSLDKLKWAIDRVMQHRQRS